MIASNDLSPRERERPTRLWCENFWLELYCHSL